MFLFVPEEPWSIQRVLKAERAGKEGNCEKLGSRERHILISTCDRTERAGEDHPFRDPQFLYPILQLV